MSIDALRTMPDGSPWGPEGRAAFRQIQDHQLMAQRMDSFDAERMDWPGRLVLVCTYEPHFRPANALTYDLVLAKGALVDAPAPGPAPVLTTDLADVTVANGVSAVLTSTATGWTSRRWEYEESPGDVREATGAGFGGSGNTTTYTTNPTNTWHNGRKYRVVFANAAGETPSRWATVTVTSPTSGGGGDTPAGLSDQMVFFPTSATGWERHTGSGHETDVSILTAPAGGLPITPYLTARITHHAGDVFAGGARSEYRPKPDLGVTEGLGFWLAYAVWLPVGEPTPNGWGRIRWQMHGGSGSPVLAIRHDTDNTWKLDIRGGSSSSPSTFTASTGVTAARGAWTKFKLYALPSDTTSGISRLWINGTQVVNQTRRNRYTGSSGYMKFGVYGSDTGATTSVSVLVPHISRLESDVDEILASF